MGSTKPDVIQDVYNALTEIRSHQAQQDASIRRLRTMTKLDERELLTGAVQNNRETIKAVNTLTKQVRRVLDEKNLVEPGLSSQDFYRIEKRQRSKEVEAHLVRIKMLSSCKQTKTAKCPCGKHHGIKFTDSKGATVEENLCPRAWWVMQSRVEFEKRDGSLGRFVQSTPIATYVGAYALK